MRMSTLGVRRIAAVLAGVILGGAAVFAVEQAEQQRYKVHDMSRPRPPVITPGTLPAAPAAWV